ncbi:multicomponent Na+:H+ antiporter subunit A [Lipingzhangella halophila]|uniref:Multicomponent Na+:H+ antiporter subunit A n=1 Tax=Lipingzhangella halophila TaxID=1783352 RepID=A0A7W7W011_9ACTN|nr:hydrogen gas-evolving membrane-bound hydrogenase subunit E [Lipingzhangella halophila]MBB4929427.1 multicomponent Na+:H+ antiporter subunit A [Lipingzhangella halophila]
MTVFIGLAATAAAAPLLASWLGRAAGWPLAGAFAVLTAIAASQAPDILAGRPAEFAWAWIPSVDAVFRLRLDGLGLLFTMLVLGIGALIMAYCGRYFAPESSQSRFYTLMGIFAVAMLGLVLADDLLLLFVFWELTSICSFFLIGGAGDKAVRPAMRALVLTAGGGLALLAAVALVSVHAGTTQLSVILSDLAWAQGSWVGPTVAVLVIIAAITKSAQVPFHFWLPGAMAASTPVSAYLHAAAMVKAGIYLLMRFTPAFHDLALWNALLVTAGLATAIYGALLAFRQNDLKTLAAYSTVSQLGYLVAIIGVGTYYALGAAALHTLAHALFKATLFMMVGVIDHQAGTRDLRDLGGLRSAMPVSAVVTGVAALSTAGVPPLLGFYSKEKIFAGFVDSGGPVWAGPVFGVLAVVAAVLTFGYSARFWFGVFGGPLSKRTDVREASAAFLLSPAITGAAGAVLGLGVVTLAPYASQVVADTGFPGHPVEIHLVPGLTVDLGMSIVAIALGVALHLGRARVYALLDRVRAPFTGDGVFDRLLDGTVRAGHGAGDLTRTFSPAAHLPAAIVLLGVLGGATFWWGMPVGPSQDGVTRPTDWLVVACVAVGVVAAAAVSSRIAAVVLLGVVGALMGIWFLLLGAVDVALTQLVVEVLTVVVMVLVLRRLPLRFHRTGAARRGLAAALAIGAGVLVAAGTLALTNRRELSEVSAWLMANSYEETGGINVVNTILVDFRALDTLGEVTVVGLAALGIVALLDTTRLTGAPPSEFPLGTGPEENVEDNAIVARTVGRIMAPAIVLLSLYMLFRGHNDHGGGFIGALVAGAGLALAHVAAANPRRSPIRALPYVPIIAGGLMLALATGLLGYIDGGFLRPLHLDIGSLHLSSAVVFDVGVYLIVVGAVIAALHRMSIAPLLERDTVAHNPKAERPADDEETESPMVAATSGGRDAEEGEL